MTEKVEFRKIRDFGEVITDTFLFMRQNLKPLLKTFVFLCGFFIVATMLSAIVQQIGMQKTMRAGGFTKGAFDFTSLGQIFNLNYLILVIFMIANYTAIYVTVFSYIAIYVERGRIAPSVEEVWAYFKYYFFRLLGSSLVISVFMILCLVCCIIPFIYVFPAMSLFYPVMILENGGLSYSFGRSFKLLKTQWWITAGTIFILWLVTYACMSFASLPAIALTLFSTFTRGPLGTSNLVIIISTVIQHLCHIFMIIPVAGTAMIYYNLAERQENAGLLDKIDKFGIADANTSSTPEEY